MSAPETILPTTEEILAALEINDEHSRQLMGRLATWSSWNKFYRFDERTDAQLEFIPGLPIEQIYAPWPVGPELSPILNPAAIPVSVLKPTVTGEGEPAVTVIGRVSSRIVGDRSIHNYRKATVSIADARRDGHTFRVTPRDKAA